MEERVPSARSSTEYFPPLDSPPSSPPSSPPPSHHNSIIIKPLPPPPGSTFVIQTSRDQVFRVPPPENSKIVESYVKQNQTKKGPANCIWILIAIATVGVSLGVFFGVIAAIYIPEIPEFEITQFRVDPTPPSHDKKQPKHVYEITLNVKNPNPRMDVSYGGDRYGLLSFEHRKVADGKFEPFSQEAEHSSNLKINLKQSAKVELPSEMEKSMNSTKSKMAESLGFKMFVSLTISSWAKTSHKDISVTCTFKVNTLAKDTRIVYQECSADVQ
ncbi:NDR1/HIN1-like protein 13 [Apium graveolens]|uniref:NDR1/HIN1-like protein 13 n=1 Tax=Apium graveolens TaxID=4045 RepID=UPI003D7A3A7F